MPRGEAEIPGLQEMEDSRAFVDVDQRAAPRFLAMPDP
jgi:hypothetical protein